MAKEDGGPAFANMTASSSGPVNPRREGMSLRDWFAGQALIGLCQAHMSAEEFVVSPALLARTAYAMADAMLAERAK